jgi:hypothetical protein
MQRCVENRAPQQGTAEGFMEIVGFLVVLVAFDIAAWRWGVDSSDGFESREWERRRNWSRAGGE